MTTSSPKSRRDIANTKRYLKLARLKGENMILGLYEAHLPVSNLHQSIEFYSKLGLELAWRDEDTAFFWIEKDKS
ncbi:catechol-2,3-dioxygenase [Paenibacillus sp. DS2363]